MAQIDNGCVCIMRLCNWIPIAKELERQEKESAQAIAQRLAERLRLLGIDERADLRAAVESNGCANAFPSPGGDAARTGRDLIGERAVCSTSHLSETVCCE